MLNYRDLLLPIMLSLALISTSHGAQALPAANDLHADGQLARQQNIPILVFYAASWCHYCEEVQALYLEPMHRSGDYRGRLLFRLVDIDSDTVLRDFQGRQTTQRRFAHAQGVGFTPIVRFYDGQGRELATELYGYASPDFYAGLLEQAITGAQQQLKAVAD